MFKTLLFLFEIFLIDVTDRRNTFLTSLTRNLLDLQIKSYRPCVDALDPINLTFLNFQLP